MKRQLLQPRVVGVGGGTGLPVLLAGLDGLLADEGGGAELSAIVTVADSGGSTGLLRQQLDIPGVGDLRNCMVALAGEDSPLGELFQHRFPAGGGLEGHALGNLIVAASLERSRNLLTAVDELSRLLEVAGRVFPVTETAVHLCAEFAGGRVVRGEAEIRRVRGSIERIWLEPEDPDPAPGVLDALVGADVIVLGPGSLYTSLVPNLLVPGVADAIQRSRGLKIFVCNLMTEPGETDDMTAADHLRLLEEHLGPRPVDVCVLNATPIPEAVAARYAAEESVPVTRNDRKITRMGVLPVGADLMARDTEVARHDPGKLARLIVSLAAGELRGPGAVLRFDPATLGRRDGSAGEARAVPGVRDDSSGAGERRRARRPRLEEDT